MDEPLSRDIMLYQVGNESENPNESQLLQMTLRLDTEAADLNQFLVETLNQELASDEILQNLTLQPHPVVRLPKKIILIDASNDNLPLGAETERVLNYHRQKKGWTFKVVRINSREELRSETSEFPQETLILSQCVNKKTYHLGLAKELMQQSVIIVPGLLTAPGGILSDKGKTYRLLSDDGQDWRVVSPYREIQAKNKSEHLLASEILDTANLMHREWGVADFYVKPLEGGGGLGGFRMTKVDDCFVISDLSKVTGEQETEIKPVYLNIDPADGAKIRELAWIFRLFESDANMKKAYLWVTLDTLRKRYAAETDLEALRSHLHQCNQRTSEILQSQKISYRDASLKIGDAIARFNQKYPDTPYQPLVNKHIDFGTWGLRIHLRLTQRGIQVETMYGRIFQLALTNDGVGYVGSDNISNKQTGKLEPIRLRPVDKIMLDAIGGLPQLRKSFFNAAFAFYQLIKTLPRAQQDIIPLRVQMDMAPVSAIVCEGNADTARGLVLAQRWNSFIRNNLEWFDDALGYYSRMKR
ncbi:hypothetical protein JXJ21_24990 [candidate division KSB1 bacterium]|nr:hypothetical protein [candidate division KSB1 bacterium]